MFPRLFSLMMLSAAPLLAELSYFPAQPARLTPGELLGYKCEIMELLDYDPGRPDLAKRARALELIRENKNDCVNDRAGHDGIEYTPLYVACQRRDAELVQALLEQGADANHPRLQKLQGRLTPEIETLLQ
ncbi:MAG: ankyrin repeat domain-containing protein, partial [Akkermansia sp.]|nr:ankyrin repeat domain-containing protein [Akkermansia sp.]